MGCNGIAARSVDERLRLLQVHYSTAIRYTLCTGDPLFELATVFVSYHQFPSIEPKAAYMFGIDVDTAAKICDRIFELYLDEANEETLRDAKIRAQLLGCIRIIDFMGRHAELPDRKKCIDRCVQDIKKILQLGR